SCGATGKCVTDHSEHIRGFGGGHKRRAPCERFAAPRFEIPAKMLAGMAKALPNAIMSQHIFVVAAYILGHLSRARGHARRLGASRMVSENPCLPGRTIMGATDHHRVGT